jgi:hypothetical protein
MVDPHDDIRSSLLLSVQRALLGAVPPSLRAVTCDWVGTEIRLRFVFDGPIDPDDHEGAQIAGTEVIADFSSPWTIDEEIVRLDYPADLNEEALPHWVYLRKESTTDGDPLH